jgi:tight adherence protein B
LNTDLYSLALPLIIIGLGYVGLLVAYRIVFSNKVNVNERLSGFIEAPSTRTTIPTVTEAASLGLFARIRSRFNLAFGILNSEEMQRKLVAANWQISVSEYFFIRVGAVIFSFLLGVLLFRNIWAGLGLTIIAYIVPGFLLFRSIEHRQKIFQNQLIDSLTLLRGAVEAGYSFLQGLNVVIEEMGSPTNDEFRIVRREVELGLPLGRALTNMANRMESDDFYMVVTAVNINMQVGGSLATILGVVIDTLRQRAALLGELRSITSYARYASYLLTLMPFITVAVIALVSPDYISSLFEPGLTRIILIYAISSLVVGNIVLRRLSVINV